MPRDARSQSLNSGGVCEFVIDGETGLVAAPDPRELASAFDRLFEDRDASRSMGLAAREQVRKLGIDWDTVVSALTR